MKIEIRTATLDDVKILREFEQSLIESERLFDNSIKNDHIIYYDIEDLISKPDAEVVIAKYENDLVGCGYARIEKGQSFFSYSKYCFLGFMYVKREYRGNGINQKIIERLEHWSLQNGIAEMRLEVYCENQAAIRSYEKAGFSKLVIEMKKTLG